MKINGIRITESNGEFYVTVKPVGKDCYKQDSIHYSPEHAVARVAELMGIHAPNYRNHHRT